MSTIDKPAVAQPIQDHVWCTECGEPHGFHEGRLHVLGQDRESMVCQVPVRVKAKPEDWERTYEALSVYDFKGGFQGYDLYETSPEPDPAIHRPMYYLEEA